MRTAALLLLLAATALDSDRRVANDPDRYESRMLEQINAERVRRNLPPLRRDPRLDRAAAEHSRRMADARRLSHRLRGEPPLRDRIAATGVRFDKVAENVGFSTRIGDLHPNLMRSRGHRANLLDRELDAIGIAIVDRDGRWYVTQTFANSTSDASRAEAERAFARAIETERRRRRLEPAAVQARSALRDAACRMAERDDLDPGIIPAEPGQREVLAFTTFEPAVLEGAAAELASQPDLGRVTFGVCHRSTRRYPSGVFWFAVAH